MPILLKYQQSNFELLIWQIIESSSSLEQQLQLPKNQSLLLQKKYSHSEAWQQWLASRCGLQELFNTSYLNFQKNKLGKLELIDQSFQLSISHSGNYISVAKSKQPIGIDLQVPSPKLERIAAKYIAPKVLSTLKNSPYYIDYLHLYWGIKEALFKAYGQGQVNFIQHLHISPFAISRQGTTTAKIIKPAFEATYKVFYEKTSNYYLCVVTKV
ncbi:4'-phosphopantetheinyl transferase family protein [Aureispira anguillae]|uniref:4'-phosphopantetheinyl transferase superfamily protein n=1 Tax=Aureispira anguillae TaxID=2864201 RepID=A0A916DUV2_9BACT|nr:4'-phosphopantetheinyl transferase superfamily protein [Aureispira anguillae]BDS13701.1 4'-phosphopantetheinyl transferase superfamily protein [Aureispira anguillae]